MRDEIISLPRIKQMHPAVVDEVIALIEKAETGFPTNGCVRVTEGFRSFAYQDELFQKGRTTAGPRVTNAPAGTSFHNYGLAFDGVVLIDGQMKWGSPYWDHVVQIFKSAGWMWGGDFKTIHDAPHLQKTFGHGNDYAFFLAKYHNDEFIPNTRYVQV